jgi:hypothetical protein
MLNNAFSQQSPSIPSTTADPNLMDLRVGGKYRLGKKIGSGSFGGSFHRFYQTSFDLARLTHTLNLR